MNFFNDLMNFFFFNFFCLYFGIIILYYQNQPLKRFTRTAARLCYNNTASRYENSTVFDIDDFFSVLLHPLKLKRLAVDYSWSSERKHFFNIHI